MKWIYKKDEGCFEGFAGDCWLTVYATDKGWGYDDPTYGPSKIFKTADEAKKDAERMCYA